MVQPIDYIGQLQAPDLGQSLLSGLQAGAAFRQVRDERQQREQAQAQQEQYRADLQNALSNPTAKNFAALQLKYPEQGKNFRETFNMLDKDQRQAEYGAGIEVYHALQNNNPQAALQSLDKHIAALENSGQDTSDLVAIRSQVERDPNQALGFVGLTLSSLDPEGFSKATETQQKQAEAPYSLQKVSADAYKAEQEARNTPERLAIENAQGRAAIRNIDNQIYERARRFNLDAGKMQSKAEQDLAKLQGTGVELDKDGRKLINDSIVASVGAAQSADQALDLADRLEKEGGGFGAFSTASEWLNKATGTQDSLSALRTEYNRLRTSQAIKLLPPGPATDKDVALALEGFPPGNANAATLSSFLRGMAKLNKLSADTENAKAEWVNGVGHLGKPRTDIDIAGKTVKAGTTFTEFARDNLKKETEAPKPASPTPAPGRTAPAAPAAGTVVDGYTFLGGNPADPASWRKQ